MPTRRPAVCDRHARFAAEYLKDLNATQAAIRCGYSARTAYARGSRLLGHPGVQAIIQERQSKRLAKADITADRILTELLRLATYDVRALYDAQGNVRPLSEWPDDVAAAVQGMDVVKRNIVAGDGHLDRVLKLRLANKDRALELLAKHLGLLTEKVEHSGGIEVSWKGEE